MSLEQLSHIAQLVSTLGAIVSLLIVAFQIRANTRALERNEHDTTMSEWTLIRQAMVAHRDVAELMTAGLHGERELDAADQLRLELMLQECTYAAFHTWERMQRRIFPTGTFQMTAGAYLAGLLRPARGNAWWQGAKRRGFPAAFAADVDALLASASGAAVQPPAHVPAQA